MRINIIGPSGSGKTTLSKWLAKKERIKSINLDKKFIDLRRSNRKKFVFLDQIKIDKNIDECISGKDWIIEGIYPIDKVLQASDFIVFVKPPMIVSLWGVWNRYMRNKYQRQKFGFLSYLNLTKVVLKQYLCKKKFFTISNRTYNYPTLSTVEEIVYGKYWQKVVRVPHGRSFRKMIEKDSALLNKR